MLFLLNVLLVLTHLALISTAGNRPEASRHLRHPHQAAQTQPQPPSANRVRAPLLSSTLSVT